MIKVHGIGGAFERLGLEYRRERLGMRNRVERFFGYLKERTAVFHHKLSARKHIQGIINIKLFLNLIHTLLSGLKDGEVSENAYLDTIPNPKSKACKSRLSGQIYYFPLSTHRDI